MIDQNSPHYVMAKRIYENPHLRPDREEILREREFMENLIQTRFNFFIITFGVILVYGLTSEHLEHAFLIMTIGDAVLIGLAVAIYRIYIKLEKILFLLRFYPKTPVGVIGLWTRLPEHRFNSVPATHLIGYLIPVGACLALGALCIAMGISLLNGIKVLNPFWFLLSLALAFVPNVQDLSGGPLRS